MEVTVNRGSTVYIHDVFEDSLQKILLGPFLNTLAHLKVKILGSTFHKSLHWKPGFSQVQFLSTFVSLIPCPVLTLSGQKDYHVDDHCKNLESQRIQRVIA